MKKMILLISLALVRAGVANEGWPKSAKQTEQGVTCDRWFGTQEKEGYEVFLLGRKSQLNL